MRPGTQLLERDFQLPGEDGLPAGAMSTNVGGMGAHWTCACPRPGEGELIRFLPDLEELLDESERLLGVSRNPFADAPYADEVRRRLSAEFDEGRAPGRRVAPMPLAVHTRADGELVWSGPAVVFGEAARGNPDFTLLAEALVTRVIVEDGRAPTGVVVLDRTDGTEHTVRARFVVVAADAFRTPQVLFASGVRPRPRSGGTSTTSRRSCSRSGCATSTCATRTTPPRARSPARAASPGCRTPTSTPSTAR